MARPGLPIGGVSNKRLAVIAVTTALVVAVVAFSIGLWKASAKDGTRLDIHRVEVSPQDVRKSWTPERLQDAKQGDPMPNITE